MQFDWSARPVGAVRRPHRGRPVLAALAAAGVLAAVLAGAVLASAGPTDLSDPAVSPRTATAGAAVTFSVTFLNHNATDATYVRVTVGSQVHALSRTATGSTRDGVRYAASFAVPVGTWPVTFESSAGTHVSRLAAGSVTVAVAATPAPTPRPTTQPTAPPTQPTPHPTVRPTPSPPPPSPTPMAVPTPAATNGPTPTQTAPGAPPSTGPGGPGASGSESLPGVIPPIVPPGASPDETASGAPDGSAPPAAGTTGGADPNGGSGPAVGRLQPGGTPWAGSLLASSWLPPLLGGRDLTDLERVLATTITTTTGVTLAMSFAFFGKRRRDSEPTGPDDVLEEQAGQIGEPANGALVPAAEPALVGELALPRWRRPSLLEARKADPTRTPRTTYSLSFDSGVVSAIAGLERRRIRYRVVRLLDGPDELMASEIGFLDEGDEVQLVERSGSFWNVLCPDGRAGWVHRMVLGDIVGEEPDLGIDPDVLAAFRASRAQAS